MRRDEKHVSVCFYLLQHTIHELALSRREQIILGLLKEYLAMLYIDIFLTNRLELLRLVWLGKRIIYAIEGDDFYRLVMVEYLIADISVSCVEPDELLKVWFDGFCATTAFLVEQPGEFQHLGCDDAPGVLFL